MSGEEKCRCENFKWSTVLKTIDSGKNRTITFQQTLHNHKALTRKYTSTLTTGLKRKATENNCKAPRKITH